jgi:septal ring factor EnvC (AmiA/AmiB activator)
MFLHRESDV